MRGIRVWARLLGLRRTVIEDVFIDEDKLVVVARPDWRERDRCGVAGAGRRGPIRVRAGGAGGRWISGRRWRSWRPRRRG